MPRSAPAAPAWYGGRTEVHLHTKDVRSVRVPASGTKVPVSGLGGQAAAWQTSSRHRAGPSR